MANGQEEIGAQLEEEIIVLDPVDLRPIDLPGVSPGARNDPELATESLQDVLDRERDEALAEPGDPRQARLPTTGEQVVPDHIRLRANVFKTRKPGQIVEFLKSEGYDAFEQPDGSGDVAIRYITPEGQEAIGSLEKETFDGIGDRIVEMGKDFVESPDDVLQGALHTAFLANPVKGLSFAKNFSTFARNVPAGGAAEAITGAIVRGLDPDPNVQAFAPQDVSNDFFTGGVIGASSTGADIIINQAIPAITSLLSRPVASILDQKEKLAMRSMAATSKERMALNKLSVNEAYKELWETSDLFDDVINYEQLTQKAVSKYGGKLKGKHSPGIVGEEIGKKVPSVSRKIEGRSTEALIGDLGDAEAQLVDSFAGDEGAVKAVRKLFDQVTKRLPDTETISLKKLWELTKEQDRILPKSAWDKSIEELRPGPATRRTLRNVFNKNGIDAVEAGVEKAIRDGDKGVLDEALLLRQLKREFHLGKAILPSLEKARSTIEQTGGQTAFAPMRFAAGASSTGAATFVLGGGPTAATAAGLAGGLVSTFPRQGVGVGPSDDFLQQALTAKIMRGKANFSPRATAELAAAAPISTLISTPARFTNLLSRSASNALTAPGGIGAFSNTIKNVMVSKRIKNLQDTGAIPDGITEEEAQEFMSQVEQSVQAELQQAVPLFAQLELTRNDEDRGLIMTQLAKTFPDAFEAPKTGIVGEIQIGGKTRLLDPADRKLYSQMLERNDELDGSQKTEMISALNFDGTVIAPPKPHRVGSITPEKDPIQEEDL